jgi:hypothetical protein
LRSSFAYSLDPDIEFTVSLAGLEDDWAESAFFPALGLHFLFAHFIERWKNKVSLDETNFHMPQLVLPYKWSRKIGIKQSD